MPTPSQSLDKSHYVIRGGIEGRARLRILSRVMWPSTLNLLQRAGISCGMTCLDIGCGGGDVSCELARLVGPAEQSSPWTLTKSRLLSAEEAAALNIPTSNFASAISAKPSPWRNLILFTPRFSFDSFAGSLFPRR